MKIIFDDEPIKSFNTEIYLDICHFIAKFPSVDINKVIDCLGLKSRSVSFRLKELDVLRGYDANQRPSAVYCKRGVDHCYEKTYVDLIAEELNCRLKRRGLISFLFPMVEKPAIIFSHNSKEKNAYLLAPMKELPHNRLLDSLENMRNQPEKTNFEDHAKYRMQGLLTSVI